MSEYISEADNDGIPVDDELYAAAPTRKKKLFGFAWNEGYVAPFRPTPDIVVETFISNTQLQPHDVFVDLGCGDGRVVNAVCAKYGCKGIGVDLDVALLEQCKTNAEAQNISHLVSFQQQDLFQFDFTQTSFLFMYLLPETLEKLKPTLLPLLHRGVPVVTVAWAISGWDHWSHFCSAADPSGGPAGYYTYSISQDQ
eukprot:GILJ01009596.1.p1 GENE.GILJ01009596.1~~GILJ01009596.1.p1  ORF type:complete len:211 (+),score=17.50 GILJ01009596.1:45-635(+)